MNLPCLQIYEIDKGFFGYIFVETNKGGFDANNFLVGTIETEVGEISERFWYDHAELKICGETDVDTKGMASSIGYVQSDMIQPMDKEAVAEAYADMIE